MKVWSYVITILGMMVLLDFSGLHSDPVGILYVFGFTRDLTTNVITFSPSFSAIISSKKICRLS